VKAFDQSEIPIQRDTRRQAVKLLDGPLIDAWMRAQTDDGRAFVLLRQVSELRSRVHELECSLGHEMRKAAHGCTDVFCEMCDGR
jgi:hypothetical protein